MASVIFCSSPGVRLVQTDRSYSAFAGLYACLSSSQNACSRPALTANPHSQRVSHREVIRLPHAKSLTQSVTLTQTPVRFACGCQLSRNGRKDSVTRAPDNCASLNLYLPLAVVTTIKPCKRRLAGVMKSEATICEQAPLRIAVQATGRTQVSSCSPSPSSSIANSQTGKTRKSGAVRFTTGFRVPSVAGTRCAGAAQLKWFHGTGDLSVNIPASLKLSIQSGVFRSPTTNLRLAVIFQCSTWTLSPI